MRKYKKLNEFSRSKKLLKKRQSWLNWHVPRKKWIKPLHWQKNSEPRRRLSVLGLRKNKKLNKFSRSKKLLKKRQG